MDAKDLGECVHGNESGIVTPRLGAPYPTLPAAIRKIENVGGYISAPTLTALQAIVPSYNYQLARDDSTGDEYRWNPAATPAQWEPTGRNFIKESKDYTDQKTKKLDDVLEQEYPFSVSDGSGRTAFAILEDGTTKAAEVDTDVLSVAGSKIEEDDLPFSIADKNGKYALALKPDGTTVAASIETNELKVGGKDINSIVGQVRKTGLF
ncbi:hypothetical protein WAI62_05640 [Acinetobacter baumannii]